MVLQHTATLKTKFRPALLKSLITKVLPTQSIRTQRSGILKTQGAYMYVTGAKNIMIYPHKKEKSHFSF